MKYPKLRDGASPVGEAHIRQLDGLDMPFAKKVGTDSVAYTRNGFPEVHRQSIDEGFFSLGQVQADEDPEAPSHVVASDNARAFARRGEFGQAVSAVVPALNYAGAGQMYVASEPSPNVQHLYRTRNGRDFQFWVAYVFTPDLYSPNIAAQGVQPARYETIDGRMAWANGFSYFLIQNPDGDVDPDGEPGGDWNPMYALTLDGETWENGLTLMYAGVRHGRPSVSRVGPRTLVMMTPVYRRSAVGEPGTTPAPFMSMSSDNGQTWELVGATTFIETLLDVNAAGKDVYNETVDRICHSFFAVAINANTCYVTAFNTQLPNEPLYLGVLDLNTKTISGIREFVEPTSSASGHEAQIMAQTATLKSRGVYVSTFADIYDPTLPVVIRRSPDLDAWEQTVTAFESRYAGFVMAYDENTLLMPYYDGRFSLYESRDAGVTWRRRGTIHSKAAAPPDDGSAVLQRFGVLTMARKDGMPARSFPDMPWVGDARVPPPA